jgi:hypothetical protein
MSGRAGAAVAALGALLGAACAGPRAESAGPRAPVRVPVPGGPGRADELVTLPTRPGVTERFLLLSHAGAAPAAVAVLFPGGAGVIPLPDDPAALRRGRNFLVRSRELFVDRDVAVALVDAPSDRQEGMSDGFRSGGDHRRDVEAVLAELRGRFPGARVFLVGTSRGTVSAAWLGRALGNAVAGVVLTSTVFASTHRAEGLQGFDFGRIGAPLLFVHHASDACPICPYADAARLGARFPLVTVRGGRPPESEPCDALSAHGYLGREAETVAAIKAWMMGREVPRVVGE